MNKVLIVYWSGTGNTQAMAEALAEGVTQAGGEPDLQPVSSVSASAVEEYGRIAFGCPSMGDEVLEEDEMEPFFTQAQAHLKGKKIALFGSYDWGDGLWMRNWAERSAAAGADICGEGLIAHLEPDHDALAACRKLGSDLANA